MIEKFEEGIKVHKRIVDNLLVKYSELGFDININELMILNLIFFQNINTITAISNFTKLKKSNISTMVNRLVEKDLIRYEISSKDKRKKYLVPNPESKVALLDIKMQIVQKIENHIGKENWIMLNNIIDSLCDIDF